MPLYSGSKAQRDFSLSVIMHAVAQTAFDTYCRQRVRGTHMSRGSADGVRTRPAALHISRGAAAAATLLMRVTRQANGNYNAESWKAMPAADVKTL